MRLHADVARPGGPDAKAEKGPPRGQFVQRCHSTGGHRQMAHRGMSHAWTDANFLGRHADGSGKNVELAPDHVGITDPKPLVAERFGCAGEIDTFPRMLNAVEADACFDSSHPAPRCRAADSVTVLRLCGSRPRAWARCRACRCGRCREGRAR